MENHMTFLEYMKKSDPWYGLEGDFVKDALSTTRFPHYTRWKEYKRFLSSRIPSEAVKAAHNVWKAYWVELDEELLV